jgi:hypothetical protein
VVRRASGRSHGRIIVDRRSLVGAGWLLVAVVIRRFSRLALRDPECKRVSYGKSRAEIGPTLQVFG